MKITVFNTEKDNLKKVFYNLEIKDTPLTNDWTYGLPISSDGKILQFSYNIENDNFKRKINDIKAEDNELVEIQTSAGTFKTEYRNWRDNFYFLNNDEKK